MSWSKEEALTDPAVRDAVVFASEFRFHLRDIATEITIRLYRPLHSSRMIARRSHNLTIPEVSAAPAAATEEPESEGAALHMCVNELLLLYNAARAKGMAPQASWLTPNEGFC